MIIFPNGSCYIPPQLPPPSPQCVRECAFDQRRELRRKTEKDEMTREKKTTKKNFVEQQL